MVLQGFKFCICFIFFLDHLLVYIVHLHFAHPISLLPCVFPFKVYIYVVGAQCSFCSHMTLCRSFAWHMYYSLTEMLIEETKFQAYDSIVASTFKLSV